MQTHQCQNCDSVFTEEQLAQAFNLGQRVAPGEAMPSGECPKCGALCHPVDGPPKDQWQTELFMRLQPGEARAVADCGCVLTSNDGEQHRVAFFQCMKHARHQASAFTEWIETIWTENTGGGCMVDYIKLKSGIVLTLNDESIVAWKDEQDALELGSGKAEEINSMRFTTDTYLCPVCRGHKLSHLVNANVNTGQVLNEYDSAVFCEGCNQETAACTATVQADKTERCTMHDRPFAQCQEEYR